MTQAQTIALYQPLLVTIAQNLVRCKQDAEDIVQEVFVKWLCIEQSKIENTKAYLIRSVTNTCLNHLNSFKKKKQEYLDSIHFNEFLHRIKESNFAHLDLDINLNQAFKALHAKLEPLERAVFLMKEVFDFDYQAIQQRVIEGGCPALLGAFCGEGMQFNQQRRWVVKSLGRLLGHHAFDELRKAGWHVGTVIGERG